MTTKATPEQEADVRAAIQTLERDGKDISVRSVRALCKRGVASAVLSALVTAYKAERAAAQALPPIPTVTVRHVDAMWRSAREEDAREHAAAEAAWAEQRAQLEADIAGLDEDNASEKDRTATEAAAKTAVLERLTATQESLAEAQAQLTARDAKIIELNKQLGAEVQGRASVQAAYERLLEKPPPSLKP